MPYTQPDLLFLLRGVDHNELITAGEGSRRARRRSLSGKDLEDVFGVELDEIPDEAAIVAPNRIKSSGVS